MDENTVNAVVEDVVTPQESEQVNTEESVQSEVANTPTEDKPVQSPDENARFADVRRKAEREAQDRLISEMYGESHGIHTKADYDRAVAEAKEAELLESLKAEETDPKDIYSELKKNDPDFQELQKIKSEHYINKQREELNADLSDLGIDLIIKTDDDLDKLPNADKVADYIRKGNTLSESYFLANKKEIVAKQLEKAQQDTIKKIQANGESTPGSLSDKGDTTQLYTREQVDNMTTEDVMKNYELVMKSMKTWK